MSLPRKSLLGLLLALVLAPAFAAPAARKSPTDVLRPTGPVTVAADRAEWSKGGAMIYTGKVSLESDKLKMSGDRLELMQLPGNQYTAKITGALAHLEHAGELDDKGQPTPTVTADGSILLYDTRSGVVDVMGSAKMTRGKDEVTGNTIRYNVPERRIQATGGEGGQVRIVIQPPPDKRAPAQKSPESKAVDGKTSDTKAADPTPPEQKPAEQKPPESKT